MEVAAMLAPLLTERDDAESAEGGIDPLGLYTIADSLGVRLVPGVRERQSHPRFLTTLAVSLSLCGEFDEETTAADGSSEPWLVFEWYVVEGLVRAAEDTDEIRGLPGSLKARRARDDHVPLSARRYLKTPSVFGCQGIYRVLARELGIEDKGGYLGTAGYELLNVWAAEQLLEGFVGTGAGPGQSLRRQWTDAVKDGLDKASTARGPGWSGWKSFRDHLGIYNAGHNERRFMGELLMGDTKGFRRDVLEFLISPAGREALEAADSEQGFSERRFHDALRPVAGAELRELIDAISSYETFARLCQDAFDDCLVEMTRQRGRTSPADLGRLKAVQLAASGVPEVFTEVLERLEPFGEAARFRESFGSLAERGGAEEWAERLAEHHRTTQKRKPPDGKNPWFHRRDNETYIINPLYCREQGGRHDDSYVHAYRTQTLRSFALDLKLI
jgi:hypothetical protein